MDSLQTKLDRWLQDNPCISIFLGIILFAGVVAAIVPSVPAK